MVFCFLSFYKATNDGMHYRAVPWVLFSMRIEGFLYYKDGGTTLWDDSGMSTAAGYQPPRPRISAALFREGMEDYEYLYQVWRRTKIHEFFFFLLTHFFFFKKANCRSNPVPFKQNQVDATSLR